MGVIADLMVRVGADTAAAQAGLTGVDTKLEETAAKGQKFGGIMAGAGLLAAGAVTGVVAFAAAAIAKTEEAGQAAFEMSEKFGMTGQQASEWAVVGKSLGLSSEQIGKGFQFLSKNAEAMALTLQTGHQVAAGTLQPYKDLGINVLDAGGKVKSATELMLEAADAFSKMKDGPEKAAISMKLFGKSGTDLLPMLNQGRAGIEGLIASGKAQGDVMSSDQVAAAHKLFLEHKQLDTAIAGVTTQIGTALIPIMLSLIPVVIGFATHLGTVRQVITALQPWLPFIAVGLGAVAAVIVASMVPAMLLWTTTTWAHVTASIALAAANIAALWPIMLIVGGIALLVVAVILIIQHWDFLKSKTLAVWAQIKAAVLDVVHWFQGLPAAFMEMATGIGNAIVNGIVGGINTLKGLVLGAIKALLPGGANGPVVLALHAAGVPGFDQGGTVPGPFTGAPVLVQARAGEQYLGVGASRRSVAGSSGPAEVHYHIHVDRGAYIDGPSVDKLANIIALRLSYATGR